VRDIHVGGNVLTHENVIRKALTIDPGSPLSRADLLASQTRLYGRGAFSSVSVEAEPPDADAPKEGIVGRDVRVSVREAAPITQVFGVGYSSDEKLRGQYEISDRNIFGSGRYVGLQTRASDLQQRATLSYREKGLFGGSYDVLGSAFGENEVHPGFEVRTIGSSIQLSRRFTRATRTLYRYTLKDVGLSDTTASFEGSTVRLSSLASSAIHDTRDAPFDPNRGHYLSGEVQYYGRVLGSEADFVKMFAQIYRFKQIFPRTVWAQALRAGAAAPFGVSKTGPSLTCVEGTFTDSGVPPSERFFAGGDTTLRGFARDRVGDSCNGDPLGGEGMFILNEELRFPIVHALGGVVFYDAGNVYRVLADYDLGDLRQVAGAGLRFATPIGPFRLEYGALLDRKEGEPRGELFFSIGQAF
jgi:outer membrane protein assembly complex protein YaeT